MININDIRIGNYVAYADCGAFVPEIIGKPHKIAAEDFGLEYRNDGLIKYYDPIPLTEEILLKAGFGRKEDQYYFIIDRGAAHSLYIEFEFVNEEAFGSFWIGRKGEAKMILDINHIHQLQNLYYALTGQELKIEL